MARWSRILWAAMRIHERNQRRRLIRRGGPDLSGYLLYDDFSGPVGPLIGRIPKKGPAWTATGSGASLMMAGDGHMNMNDGAGQVGYATAVLDQNAGKLTSVWSTNEVAPALYPATMAFLTGFNTAVDKLVHGEQHYIRLLSPANASFIVPQWYHLSSAVYSPDVTYRTEFYVEGKFARILTFNHQTNERVSFDYVYDTDMQARMGPLAFYEIIDNKLDYTLVTAEPVPSGGFGGWPALDVRAEANFSSNADGFVGGVYGGSVSWSTPGSLTINTSGAYGSGGSIPVGPVVAGDRLWFSFDVQAGGANCIVSLAPPSGGPIGGIYTVTPDATGRYQYVIDVTATEANASFLIAGNGSGTSITIGKVLVIKNPPTSF